MKKNNLSKLIFGFFILFLGGAIFWALAIQTGIVERLATEFSNAITPRETVEISIVYAPELDSFMPQAIRDFNRAFEDGRNPVTGELLGLQDKRISVVGEPGSSGTIMQEIVNTYQGARGFDTKPTIFAPSVSHWLRLANYQTNTDLFDTENIRATANAPVVMAIWESRLRAIQEKEGTSEIGWEELIRVFESPNGWNDYGFEGRKAVFYGHTDPYISSTALSTLIQEFTASAKYISNNPDLEKLTLELVNDEEVQDGVREIEELIKHYSSRTTEFKEYIAQGPNYLDFVALEENDLIYINQGKTEYQPPEKLVALYPKEGTFMHEHPFAIPNADWVTEDQRIAANTFTDYILTTEIQEVVMENGFRPVNEDVQIGYPFVDELGVNPSEPQKVLNVPEPQVIASIQQSWTFVKKRAELYVLLDTSGSMSGQKLASAQRAIDAFVSNLPVENSMGLFSFSDQVSRNVEMESLETNNSKLTSAVDELFADGTTALYESISETLNNLSSQKDGKIRAIVLLSDGEDTSSELSLNDLVNQIEENQKSDNPTFVIPIAYGDDADVNALNAIARASSTRVIFGDTDDIDKILEVVSSYF